MTRLRLEILPAADTDIDDHAAYLAREGGLELGLRFLDAVAATFEQLRAFPAAGFARTFRDASLSGVRSRVIRDFDNYLVFYRHTSEVIEVIRVFHGARDIDRLFD